MQPVLLQGHDAQVQRGLHQTGKIHIHGLDALGQDQQRPQKPVGVLRREGGLQRGPLTGEAYAPITAGVLIFEHPVKLPDEVLKGGLLSRGDGGL